MKNSFRLLIICVVLLVIAGVVFWRGFAEFQSLTPKPAPSITNEESSSDSGQLVSEVEEQVSQPPESGEVVRVTKVIDGDTIEVGNGSVKFKVRLIGVDTPETVDPRRPVGCFGKEASNEAHRLMDGQSVVLVKDVTDTDKYGRLLRYVFLVRDDDSWLFVNDYLVRGGFAKSSTYPPDVKYQEQFKEAEGEAREAKRGLWGSKCNN